MNKTTKSLGSTVTFFPPRKNTVQTDRWKRHTKY